MLKPSGPLIEHAKWHIERLNKEIDQFLATGDLSDEKENAKNDGNFRRRQSFENGLKTMETASNKFCEGPGKEFEKN